MIPSYFVDTSWFGGVPVRIHSLTCQVASLWDCIIAINKQGLLFKENPKDLEYIGKIIMRLKAASQLSGCYSTLQQDFGCLETRPQLIRKGFDVALRRESSMLLSYNNSQINSPNNCRRKICLRDYLPPNIVSISKNVQSGKNSRNLDKYGRFRYIHTRADTPAKPKDPLPRIWLWSSY